ncbi:MAG: SDR family oxidoreductase [Pirellulales bacterium]|nr:SDR family oxidoreductase [Pirellulales bacterium]
MSNTAFTDKIVWITGATSGIGEALCRELAARGAMLVLSSRREELLKKVQSSCIASDRHLSLPLDVLAPDTFPAAVDAVTNHFGRIDILINCAGIAQRGTALETEISVDRRLMDLNYFGPVALTKLVLPGMLARHSGHIVVLSSLMGKLHLPGRCAYAASKHALHGFFDSLRDEVETQGVAVTVVCPGYIRTNASFNALEGDGKPHSTWDNEIATGMAPEKCARKISNAIARRRREVYVARYEILGLYLDRFAPGLFRWIARRKSQ